MKFSLASILLLSCATSVTAFSTPNSYNRNGVTSQVSTTKNVDSSRLSVAAALDENASSTELDYASINKLTFRALQRECKERGIPAVGTTAVLRARLLEDIGATLPTTPVAPASADECVPDGIEFCDEGDQDFDFKALLKEVNEKATIGYWKAATRKLKKLSKRYATAERPIPRETFIAVLDCCLEDRLHGARAAEPARKILEEMAVLDYDIPADMGNKCIASCLGSGPNATHDGFGGIDTALAMLAAMESTERGSDMINVETYGKVVTALSSDGAIDEAILLLRAMVVEHSFTPPLSTFADVAKDAAIAKKSDVVLQIMTLAKAAGYILDNIASAEAGRQLLASGVIAAEQMDNLALGLRLLTAAGKAEGCDPDRGDDLVASSSSAAQRACTLIHKRAIDKALQDDNWKLAVRLLELMPERSLTPSGSVWRKVVTVCCKSKKSRKATSLLLEWIQLSKEGKADKPLLSVFNSVVNTCEICDEQELTLTVLEAMREQHETDGNIITFNIALKRLAKQGQIQACEGIIIGMLEAGIEPNVVSYTTTIGGCVQAKDPVMAYEWLKRMRSRNVKPNFHTYNTVLAAHLDGKLESTVRASTIAKEMMSDVGIELVEGFKGSADYKSVIPDKYTKVLSRNLMKQLRENWRDGEVNMAVAKATIRVPLLQLVDFERSEFGAKLKEQVEAMQMQSRIDEDGESIDDVEKTEVDVDFSAVNMIQKRTMEV